MKRAMRRIPIKSAILPGAFLALLLFSALTTTGQQSSSFSAPRFDAWRILGPGGGGAQFYPAVSPLDPRLVLVACDMTGAYISHDGGDSWRLFDLRAPVKFFAFDPNDAKVIYAGAGVLWRSVDSGRTWNLVYPPPADVTRLIMPDDHASPIVETADGPAGRVTALAVDPADSKSLYATVRSGGTAALYASKDWGMHWERSTALDVGGLTGHRIYVDPHSPPTDRTLYIIGRNSVRVRKAGQWTEGRAPAGIDVFRDASAGFSPEGTLSVYALRETSRRAGGPSVVAISRDGGASWTETGGPFQSPASDSAQLPDLGAVATSSKHGETAYLSYEDWRPAAGKGAFHGVAKTTDEGRTWQLVWKEDDTAAPNVHDAWITERLGTGWGEPGISLGVAPGDPNICYRTDDGRTMRTTDGGRSWYAVYSKRLPNGTYTTTGIDVTTNYGVFFDPFDTRRMFIAYTDIGLFRSENGGESWTSSTEGVPRPWLNTTYWIAFDPAVKGRIWGAMSYVHDLPRPKMWRHTSPSTYRGGVCISEDGGRTWRASNQGMPPTAVTHILLDPTSPVGARVLYATGLGRGVFKSADGGKTWAAKNDGLPGPEPFAWRLARDENGVLYLVVARRSENGSFGNAEDGTLYRSRDGAEHWERIALPEGVNGPNGIAIDPEDPSRMYLAAWGRETPTGAADGGIFLSSDGGRSWRNVLDRDEHVYDITVDPRHPRILYACGFESSAWRSTDRGETWQRIRGFNFKWGHRVIPDPLNPAMIYVTTYGGSVWHGPATGDPHAPEDIATPVLAYTR